MIERLRRLWRGSGSSRNQGGEPGEVQALVGGAAGAPIEGTADPDRRLLPVPTPLPEQPVLLNTPGRSPARVGEVMPARRGRWPLALVRLPAVPRRAILAAGLCAGLAGPAVAKHLATRLLLGRSAGAADGVLEITRIVYTGPLTPRAAAAIGKALVAARR